MSGENRIQRRFEKLKSEGRAAFMTYVMAGDPSLEATARVLEGLPAAGVDLIELGVPFTDPMADGPAIQIAGQRALANGVTLRKVLDLVEGFREKDPETPIILMGYYNPIYSMGVDRFLAAAKEAGVDGLIIVDLPREEDAELCLPAREMGIDFVRLATPTTDDRRLPAILENTSGFVYYVSITGVTGAAAADASKIAPEIQRIKAQTDLPIVVGFGVRTSEIAEQVGRIADGVVVGTAVVKLLSEEKPVDEVLAFVASLAEGVRRAAR